MSAGVTCTDSDSSCSSFSLPRNSSSCFSSAWICAILALWSRLGAAVSPARRNLSSSASSSLTVLRSSNASRSALFMPGVSLSFIKNSTSTGLLIPVCFEKSYYIVRLILGTALRVAVTLTAASLLPNISRSVAQHQYQGLVVHTVQNVVHTPARCRCYLPHETERAMGTLIPGS